VIVESRRLAIVLADGAAPTKASLDAAWPDWADGLDLVIAADGGARHATALGLRVDRWVGDGDSIDPMDLKALAVAGVRIDQVAREKDASDTELAVLAAIEAGAASVSLIGGLGGVRVDHALTNVALLERSALTHRAVLLYDERAARLSLLSGPGEAVLVGRVGDLVTLVAVGGPAVGVTTRELHYPLRDETLEAGSSRGLSNVRTAPTAAVSIRAGRLLVIETPVTVEP